jgi:hypothetical protein
MIYKIFKISLTILFFNILISQSQFSGNANFSYANRLNDGSLLKLPYRMFELKYANESENFSLNSELAFEWNRKMDTDFLTDNNPQDFILDLRELYLTWYIPMGEIKIGKQIHSWGFVDENSPLDNLNALDYYYLFESGASKKLGSYSVTSNLYWDNFTFGIIFSPFHNTNRLPIVNSKIDSEFPVMIPIIPNINQFIELKNKQEIGINLFYSSNIFDLCISFFEGYDRIFNLSGINIYTVSSEIDLSYTDADPVFGYRKSKLAGIGYSLFLNKFTIRSDFSYFFTKDVNNNVTDPITYTTVDGTISHSSYFTIDEYGNYRVPKPYQAMSIPFKEKAEYSQFNLQLEYEISSGFNLLSQFFYYKLYNYSSKDLGLEQEVCLGNICYNPDDFDTEKLFKPGMGSSLAVLSEKAILFQLSKQLLDNQLKLNVGALLDFTNKPNGLYDNGEDFTDIGEMNGVWNENEEFIDEIKNGFEIYGKLLTFGLEYGLSDNVQFKLNISKILGSDYYAPESNYQFNLMEDFSNIRMDLKYSF